MSDAHVPQLTLRGVYKQFGETVAVAPTDLAIEQGMFVTLLGPSGCGKSTLLRMISGITAASGGEIWLRDKRVDTLLPEQRDMAMVFQSYALFPHMSVRENLAFGLRMKKVAKAEQQRRIEHAVGICNLDVLMERMPRQLSGGQQQRVALARAIVMQPALMLFDEPLSNLDAKLRDSLREELVKLHRATGATSLYVTHDQTEAMTMSDRIVIMNAGRVVETGTPIDLYRRPSHQFTARFLGMTNLLDLSVDAGTAVLPWGEKVWIDGADSAQPRVKVSIRPEDLALTLSDAGTGHITEVSFSGAQVHYIVQVGDLRVRVLGESCKSLLAIGQCVALRTLSLHALSDQTFIHENQADMDGGAHP